MPLDLAPPATVAAARNDAAALVQDFRGIEPAIVAPQSDSLSTISTRSATERTTQVGR